MSGNSVTDPESFVSDPDPPSLDPILFVPHNFVIWQKVTVLCYWLIYFMYTDNILMVFKPIMFNINETFGYYCPQNKKKSKKK